MLIVNKNLKARDIGGKKYRSPAFSLSAIFSIPFIFLAIFISASIPEREGRGVIIALVIIVLLALPVALLLSFRKISYIIGEDKLYFFDSQIKRLQSENRKRESYVRTNGSIAYSDIKEFRYLDIKIDCYPHKRTKYITPPKVVIIGDDFEVEIFAYKSLINKIKELNQKRS